MAQATAEKLRNTAKKGVQKANTAFIDARTFITTSGYALRAATEPLNTPQAYRYFGDGQNIATPIFGITGCIDEIISATESKRRKNERIILACFNLFISTKLLTMHFLKLLAQYSSVLDKGILPTLSGYTGVVGVVASAAFLFKAIVDLTRSVQKLDINFLFIDRIEKIKALDKKIEKYRKDADNTQAKEKRTALEKERLRLLNQAHALASVANAEKANPQFYQRHFATIHIQMDGISPPTLAQQKLVEHLHEKQKEKVQENVLNVTMRVVTLTASVLSLLSLVMPVLVIPSIVLGAIAATYFISKNVGTRFLNWRAKRLHFAELKQTIVTEITAGETFKDYAQFHTILLKSKITRITHEQIIGFALAQRTALEQGKTASDFTDEFLKKNKTAQLKVCQSALEERIKEKAVDTYKTQKGIQNEKLVPGAEPFSPKNKARVIEKINREKYPLFRNAKPNDEPSANASKFSLFKMKLLAYLAPIGVILSEYLSALSFFS